MSDPRTAPMPSTQQPVSPQKTGDFSDKDSRDAAKEAKEETARGTVSK